MIFTVKEKFHLSEKFIEQYEGKQPKWDTIGYITYKRSYAMEFEDGSYEEWGQTIKRVVEGCYTIQLNHCKNLKLPWNAYKSQKSAQEMYRLMFEMKFLPPGRGLWTMGRDVVYKKGSGCLQNCAFVSTKDLKTSFSEPFTFLMDFSFLGVGVAFDTKGANIVDIKDPRYTDETFFVEDTREGWVDICRIILDGYNGLCKIPKNIDYSRIRPKGYPIKTFGGICPGKDPLIKCIAQMKRVLNNRVGEKFKSTDIVDIMNILGACVVAGGVRRCLPWNTDVHTERGLVPIKEVNIGDRVKTSNGWKKVLDNVHQGEQELITINTKIGEFKCTPNHKMKVFKSTDEFEWKMAKNLNSGDRLVFHNKEEEFGNDPIFPKFNYEKPLHSTTCKDIIIPEFDEDMAWFLGYLHGDGYVELTSTSGKVEIVIHKDYKDNIMKKYISCLKRFGIDIKIYQPGQHTRHVNVFRIISFSKQLAKFLSKYKTPNNIIRVPEEIKLSKPKYIKSYLAGVFDADGTNKSRPLCLCNSIYEPFVKDLQILLSSLGIASRIGKEEYSKDNWKDIFRLNIVGIKHFIKGNKFLFEYSERFQPYERKSIISPNDYGYPNNFFDKTRYKGFGIEKQLTEYRYDILTEKNTIFTPVEVYSVDNNKIVEDTYDLTVEDNHEFVCGQGFISHNSAELSLGDPNDKEYIEIKDPEKHSGLLKEWRWASNNSVNAEIGMDYTALGEQAAKNGEPGFFWLDNVRKYGRLIDAYPNMLLQDPLVEGTNPCSEQSLLSYELCNLGELFPAKHDTIEEFLHTVKFAYMYTKTVTLVPTHYEKSNQIMLRNRRIGLSQSGLVQIWNKIGKREHAKWCNEAYAYMNNLDKKYSSWFCVPESIKKSSVKPSGSVSLLANATPGIHFPISEYYNRLIEFQKNSPILPILKKAKYRIEQSIYKDNSVVVYIPMKCENFDRSEEDVSIWEQMENVVFMQTYWSDNQVSVTIKFSKEEKKEIPRVLEIFEDRLKSVSFLPKSDAHTYKQAPYQPITEEEYNKYFSSVKSVDLSNVKNNNGEVHDLEEKFCDGDSCTIT